MPNQNNINLKLYIGFGEDVNDDLFTFEVFCEEDMV